MSKETQLPNIEEAAATLDAIYCQRFLDKMAEYGYAPEEDEAKLAMLRTALRLDSAPSPPATPQTNPYVYADEKLASVMTGAGQPSQSAYAGQNERDSLAVAMTSDPELFKVALSVLAAE